MTYKSSTPPLCIYCSERIKKHTTVNWIETKPHQHTLSDHWRYHVVKTPPTTRAECQKLTNQKVVSVQYAHDKTIRSFGTWDGESYIDKYFCNGDHAKRFAYKIARKLHE